MKEFVEKLIGRLEEQKSEVNGLSDIVWNNAVKMCIYEVNQLAEEYKDKVIIDGQYCWQTCSATEHCKECNRLCNGGIDYYENYDILAEEYNNKDCSKCSRRSWYQKGYADAEKKFAEEYNNGWIVFTQREMTEEEKEVYGEDLEYILDCKLPDDGEEIIVCYKNGYVDTDTFIRDTDGCYLDSGNDFIDDVIAWMPLPAPYQKGE